MPEIKPKCTHVIESPDNNNKAVFNIGTAHGFKTVILTGGHIKPNIIEGDRLEWKKAQKKPPKKTTSEPINKIKPNFNPFCTICV